LRPASTGIARRFDGPGGEDQSRVYEPAVLGVRAGGPGLAALAPRSQPRVWAHLGDGVPDGICLDAQGAIWYADVPNKQCVRVREGGGVLQKIQLDRGCFSCALGGTNRTTLFMVATQWRGTERMTDKSRTDQLLTARAPAAGVGWP
jgi:sugar lactone lactonase YvrE